MNLPTSIFHNLETAERKTTNCGPIAALFHLEQNQF